jgi:predicted alpha/beta superfamily hydrolase
VHVLRDVESPQLGNTRDLVVYLPPSYGDQGCTFPVVYMHDGQNAAEWRVEETMDELAREGTEAIVVGIPRRRTGATSTHRTARATTSRSSSTRYGRSSSGSSRSTTAESRAGCSARRSAA